MNRRREAYLTIDDTTSPETDALVTYLAEHKIPALFFCRGDRLDENPAPAIRALEAGFLLGNHAHSHTRASAAGFDKMVAEISRTEMLLDDLHARAGVARGPRYFRFPHMDRGCGGWIVDYDAYPDYRDILTALFAEGLNIALDPPTDEQRRLKSDLQDWLKRNGFSKMPCEGVRFPWFVETEMQEAVDAMFTFSTSDWMVGPRHRGQWPWKDEAGLIARMEGDAHLARNDSRHIILAHDQPGLFKTVRALLDHLRGSGVDFLEIGGPHDGKS